MKKEEIEKKVDKVKTGSFEEAVTMEEIACENVGKLEFLLEAFKAFSDKDETPEFHWIWFSEGIVSILEEIASANQEVYFYVQRVTWEREKKSGKKAKEEKGEGDRP